MTSRTVQGQGSAEPGKRRSLLSGHQKRTLKENLVAFAFLIPALAVVFTFGIFPIFYAAYVSLYKWRIKQNEWRGLDNYVNAMGDVAYVFFFILALALIITGLIVAYRAIKESRFKGIPLYLSALYLIPGAIIAWGFTLIILKAITFFAQEEAIAAGEAARLGNTFLGFLLIVVGIAFSIGIQRFIDKTLHNEGRVLPNFTLQATAVVLTLALGFIIARFTYSEMQSSERAAVALVRVRFLFLALIPLVIGYFIWVWGSRQQSNLKLALSILAATVFIAGGVWLATIWPTISADSDADFYQSLTVTIYYSMLTVPVQLGVSMILAYLLYQPLKGRPFFRIVFFIPYIAPAVATAGIFDAMFSLRPDSFANSIMVAFGAAPVKWLRESGSAISVLGQAFGIDAVANWDFGPSLALIVVILFNIWVFVGYDTVIFLAGLGNIPNTLYEAAKIDGAGRWSIFRHITFPLLSPTTYFLSVISIIGTFKAFNHLYVLRDPAAKGTIDSASVHFFVTFFRGARFGYSTSMAMVLFVIILVLYLVQNRIAAKSVHYG
ncbi:MAG TPA: sugar ABC transporter permease [Anaerolineae bacterium]|nr:sugar ABC transporter permease [Anaerolineae bacterium]HIP71712.1 sugar ABC transporter permease [Anaerolineae bacterium]